MAIETLRGISRTPPVKRDKKESKGLKKASASKKKGSQKKTGKVDIKV